MELTDHEAGLLPWRDLVVRWWCTSGTGREHKGRPSGRRKISEVARVLFMVIERFRDSASVPAVYRRFREKGRMMPDGLTYLDSWIEPNFGRCFLLAECEDPRLIQGWVLKWHDLVEFEVVPVVSSEQTADVVSPSE